MLMVHLALRGNGYAEIIPSGGNPVAELIPLHPDRVRPFWAPDNTVAYQYQPLNGPSRIILGAEMFHVRGLGFDGLSGLSPIRLHRETIGEDFAAQEYSARFWANDATPSGVLKIEGTLGDEAQARLRKSWEEQQTGINRHRPALLEDGLEYEAIGLTREDAQYVESRKFTGLQIARMFRIQPNKIGILDRATFSNIEQQSIEFVVDTMTRNLQGKQIREQAQAHVVLPRVTDEVAFEFRRLSRRLPKMIEVQESHRREYPWLVADVILDRSSLPWPIRLTQPQTVRVQGVADHVLGSLRDQVWAEDMKRRPFVDPETGEIDLRGYRPGDHVGSRGLEAVFEDHLRGRRGRIIERQDTGDRERTEPEPGADLVITLDIVLQARVQAILSAPFGLTRVQPWHFSSGPNAHRLPMGTPLNSAAVVLDIESGDILAMVSMPTLATGATALNPYHEDGRRPVNLNRPVEATYPPGSIAKPLVMVAALSEGLHDIAAPIECVGHYLPERRDIARCWRYRPPSFLSHGSLTAQLDRSPVARFAAARSSRARSPIGASSGACRPSNSRPTTRC
ncbi:MAG: phage portal protein [Myxococcales bacterium]|nr:phage portal protein [Myxococcales bacterium]